MKYIPNSRSRNNSVGKTSKIKYHNQTIETESEDENVILCANDSDDDHFEESLNSSW